MNLLNMKVSKEDVEEALMSMALLNAPGPNGFHAMFYQKSWDMVGDCMHKLVEDFLNCGYLIDRINNMNIVLIHKVHNPERVT